MKASRTLPCFLLLRILLELVIIIQYQYKGWVFTCDAFTMLISYPNEKNILQKVNVNEETTICRSFIQPEQMQLIIMG